MRPTLSRWFGWALLLSIVAELLFGLVFLFSSSDIVRLLFRGFHYPGYFALFGWLDPEQGVLWQAIVWAVLLIFSGIVQWLVLFLAVFLGCHWLRRKSVSRISAA
jgi:hypothetical protein